MRRFSAWLAPVLMLAIIMAGCAPGGPGAGGGAGADAGEAAGGAAGTLAYGPARPMGNDAAGPSSAYLRTAPDGRAYLVWTERDPRAEGARAAWMSTSTDGGETWTDPVRINTEVEAVQGDENLPKVAFGAGGRLHAVWSVPNARGDRMRANVRYAWRQGEEPFAAPLTLNDVPDIARFPTLTVLPDGQVLVAWIDRRVDSPEPRRIYLTRLSPDGQIQGPSVAAGGPSCECCRVSMATADGGKRVHMAYRGRSPEQIRDIVLQTSTDGGATFGEPVVVSPDGWHIEACPHSGPVLATDAAGRLHVVWYTQGPRPEAAGIYYTVSDDGGQTFAPRRLIHGGAGAPVLHADLAVGPKGEVYVVWDNLAQSQDRLQVFFRSLGAAGETMGPVQQLSAADGDALRPTVTVAGDRVLVAWTEMKEDAAWVKFRVAPIRP